MATKYKCVKGHFTDKEHDKKRCPYDDMTAEQLSESLTEEVEEPKYIVKNIDKEKYLKCKFGAKSGALNPTGEDFERATKHANLMYETFRNIRSDIPKVSKITGIEEKEIEEIKNYLFNNNEFLPDFDQAQSWNRLWKGNPVKADFVFIKHEQVEILLRKQGLSYEDAHNKANEEYNYQKEIGEYNDALLKKERDSKK